ncbi:MAG: glycosyltransferase family 1 protein, partial [Rhizobium sp.]|nr:glycosyltransferase family 1 protein [Rhizobium sp.]
GEDSDALVEPGNVQDLARVMARAVTTPDWHGATMPEPEAFRARFSASTMAEQMADLYRERLARH